MTTILTLYTEFALTTCVSVFRPPQVSARNHISIRIIAECGCDCRTTQTLQLNIKSVTVGTDSFPRLRRTSFNRKHLSSIPFAQNTFRRRPHKHLLQSKNKTARQWKFPIVACAIEVKYQGKHPPLAENFVQSRQL